LKQIHDFPESFIVQLSEISFLPVMTQIPFDQLSKQYLEEFLSPLGTVQRQYEVPGEAKYIDVWFVPNQITAAPTTDLGILGRLVQGMCLLEPFHNAPSRTQVRTAVMKLLWVQEDERRQAQSAEASLTEVELPKLRILAATVSRPLLEDFGAKPDPAWPSGVYFLPKAFNTAIVAIDELPEIPETLWVRILGRGSTQEQAIREVLALPRSHPNRDNILRLLASWKVKIDVGEIMDFSEQEALMALSEAFLEWEQETQRRSQIVGERIGEQRGMQIGEQRGVQIGEQRGVQIGEQRGVQIGEQRGMQIGERLGRQAEGRSLILRQLTRRVGTLPNSALDRINQLSLEQIEILSEALLDFQTIADLSNWLEQNQLRSNL
jgi:hypothetical protein